MAHGEVREDKVSRRFGSIQTHHTGNRGTGQHSLVLAVMRHAAARSNLSSLLQCGEQKVVGIHGECHIPFIFVEYLKLHNGRRVNRTTISRGCSTC